MISDKASLTKKDAEIALQAVTDSLTELLAKGDSIVFRNAKGQRVEMIVLEEDKLKVLVLELINGQERTVAINRAGYIKRRCDARKILNGKI